MLIEIEISKKVALINTETILKVVAAERNGDCYIYLVDGSRILIQATVKNIIAILEQGNVKIFKSNLVSP